MLAVQTKRQPLQLTLIDLASRKPNLDDSREVGFNLRDYKTFRVLSRGDLPFSAVQNICKQNPGYTCIGIASYPYGADEF